MINKVKFTHGKYKVTAFLNDDPGADSKIRLSWTENPTVAFFKTVKADYVRTYIGTDAAWRKFAAFNSRRLCVSQELSNIYAHAQYIAEDLVKGRPEPNTGAAIEILEKFAKHCHNLGFLGGDGHGGGGEGGDDNFDIKFRVPGIVDKIFKLINNEQPIEDDQIAMSKTLLDVAELGRNLPPAYRDSFRTALLKIALDHRMPELSDRISEILD